MGRPRNRHFPKEDIQIGQQAHEEMLNITKHQGTVHLNHIEISPHTCEMAIIKKTTNSKCWWERGKGGRLMHCWWEGKPMQSLWKWRFLKISIIKQPCDPAIPLLGIYLKKIKTLIQKDIYTPFLTGTVFTTAKIWKQPKCPLINEWIRIKMPYIYIHTHTHTHTHTKEILPFVITWMYLKVIMLSEISQTEKTNTM